MSSSQETEEINYEIPSPDYTWLRWWIIVILVLIDIIIDLGQNAAITALVGK